MPDVPLPSDPQVALGQAIRQLREAKELSQEDLAHLAGVTTHSVSRIENGARNPTWSTVKRLAQGLGQSLAEVAALAEKLE